MALPSFFAEVPAIRMHDSLAQLLGSAPDGVVEYHYADAVRLAGHSCPTVAGAWLCARAALKHLFGDQLPERGGISVYLPDPEDAGVTGVIAQVLTLVTGAAGVNGFKGLAGNNARNNLLHYAVDGVHGVRFRRNDTGQTVEIELDTSPVPPERAQRELISLILSGHADDSQRREFGRLCARPCAPDVA
ncbi:MAG: hypothetical protein R3F24_07745 [Gammaproteobacteria bacterium]